MTSSIKTHYAYNCEVGLENGVYLVKYPVTSLDDQVVDTVEVVHEMSLQGNAFRPWCYNLKCKN